MHVVCYHVASHVLLLADLLNAYVDERDNFSISVPEGMPVHKLRLWSSSSLSLSFHVMLQASM